MSGCVRSTRMSKWLMDVTLPGLRVFVCRFLPAYKYTSPMVPNRSGECAAQGLGQLRVGEGEAERPRAVGHRALPGQDDVGHLAVEQAHRETGDRREGRTAQRTAERAAELLVRARLGSGGVDGTAPVRAVERGQVHGDQVVDVDPRQVLPAARDRPADPEPEERKHLRQCAAALVQYDARPHAHDAQAELL